MARLDNNYLAYFAMPEEKKRNFR